MTAARAIVLGERGLPVRRCPAGCAHAGRPGLLADARNSPEDDGAQLAEVAATIRQVVRL